VLNNSGKGGAPRDAKPPTHFVQNVVWEMPELSDEDFTKFQELLYRMTGIALNASKKPLVSGRLMSRLRLRHVRTFGDYYRIVSEDAAELQTMRDLLTTNETRFFRETVHLDFFRKELERLTREKTGPIRIWSAACSTGEEPYSVAMICAESLGITGDFEIVASDISGKVLAVARNGVYPIEKTHQIPEQLLKKYCLKGFGSNQGKFCIITKLCQHISFQQINLLDPPKFSRAFDVVFLRNVMIYFDNRTRGNILQSVVETLKPGGCFIVGTAESLVGETSRLENVGPNAYRKPGLV